ncbi:MAG: amidase [Acidimicrobiia bacterium]
MRWTPTSAADPVGAFVEGPAPLAEGAPGGPLSGLRFAAKDLFAVAGRPTGVGNPAHPLAHRPAPAHAAAVAALLAAGADLVGRTHTDELAWSLSGTNAHLGTPRNPAAPGRIPGGSSSGSAAAVAAGLVELALGTDTGGSVRVPASYCGLVGLRPTHGRIDATGVVPLAPSLDTVGFLARSPAVAEAAFDVLRDRPRRATPPGRVLLVASLLEGCDDGVADLVVARAGHLATALGAEVVDVADRDGRLARAAEVFRVVQGAEAWAAHREWLETDPPLGPGVRARVAAARALTAAEVADAAAERRALCDLLLGWLAGGAVLVQPAAPGPAPDLELDPGASTRHRTRVLGLTAPASLAGLPALCLPAGRVGPEGGLPVGFVLVGAPGTDEALLAAAAQVVPGDEPAA